MHPACLFFSRSAVRGSVLKSWINVSVQKRNFGSTNNQTRKRTNHGGPANPPADLRFASKQKQQNNNRPRPEEKMENFSFFFPSIASWLSPGRSQRKCMTWINCNNWVVFNSLHGALVNPIIVLAEDRLHSPVGQSQCHNWKSRTKQKQNTSNTKTKHQTTKQKTPETQNRHCEQGQLSGKEMSCASWSHCMARENQTKHRKEQKHRHT